MNVLSQSVQLRQRTPYNTLNIALVYRSMDRKLERDQFCIECGQPFFTISDKIVAVYDGGITTEFMRTEQRVIGLRCKKHICKQHYQLEV